MRNRINTISLAVLTLILSACGGIAAAKEPRVIAIHCEVDSDDSAKKLLGQIGKLADVGVTILMVEIGYSYRWESHPELVRDGAISPTTARALYERCREEGIEIIPEINCVGHQSWEDWTGVLLETYPEFDETPGRYPGNKGIYCRSWCTSNEGVYSIIFDLIDELAAAFSARSFHVGMDEVFLIGEDSCPLCAGKDRGALFAAAVNRLYRHIVEEKGMTMYMWGDRLIDGNDRRIKYDNEYETSMNGTHAAIDAIPKEVVICDWHYEKHESYDSLPMFLDKGFRVLPASYNSVDAARALIDFSLDYSDDERMLGHLYTTWCDVGNDKLASWKPMVKTADLLK
jgi:N-acetyl-beta-hexosaminidase